MKKLALLLGLVFLLSSGLVFAQELPEGPVVDPNPALVTYEAMDGILTISTTHALPTVKVETYNIIEAQAKIDRINAVIEIWKVKKVEHQDIIDKYNEIEGK
ncbi:hypothetical protein KAX02_02735 [candidate division WOR-3 bacterium]|nr:hypothetical protein [candidate division WOR-3 bacterium]